MNVYDGCLWVWLLFAAYLGYRQGLTVIILRLVLSVACFIAFPFVEPTVNELVKKMMLILPLKPI